MLRQLGILPNIETLFSPSAFYSKLFYASGLSFKFCTIDVASPNPGQVYLYTGNEDPNTVLRLSLSNSYNDLGDAISNLESSFPQTQLSIIFVNGDFRLASTPTYVLSRYCYLIGYNEFGGSWRNNSITSLSTNTIRVDDGGIINLSTISVNYFTRESFDIYGCTFICSSPIEMILSPTSSTYINDSYLFSNSNSLFLINYNFTPVNKFNVSYSELSCFSDNSILFRTFSSISLIVMFKVYIFRTSVRANTIYEGRDNFMFDMLDASNFNNISSNSLAANESEKAIINFVSGYKFPHNEQKFNKFLIWDEAAEIISNSSISLSNLTICKDYNMRITDNLVYVCNRNPIRITLSTRDPISDILVDSGKQYTIVKVYKHNNVLLESNVNIGNSNRFVIPKNIMSVVLSLNSTMDRWIIVSASPYLC